MSTTGPYQSKLFNFLNRQSIQWGNRLTQAARRLKITVEWGAQISLYPLYMLVQTSRVAVRQIAAVQTGRQRQRALAADSQPTVLDPVATTLSSTTEDFAVTQSLQGLACDLETQDILFVDPENHTIAPSQSQTELKQQISFQLGSVNYQKRQQELARHSPNPRVLPPIYGHQPRLLPPVRWLLRGLSWLEQSPVAIAIDLFGESHWHTAVIPPEIYAPQLLPPLPLEPVLKPIDQRLAQFEQQWLTPVEPAENLSFLQRFVRRFLLPKDRTTALTKTQAPEPAPTPWLTWADLFREKSAAPSQNQANNPETTISQAALTDLVAQIGHDNQPVTLVKTPHDSSQAIASHAPQTKTLTRQESSPSEKGIEAKPEWIETKALSIGYEQHFLERILKAVDHLLAWLENTATKVLQRLGRFGK
ncbi:hypothetical protein NIES970_14910 [[Synechococcus] sp. NIES-970]|nr:hypothetical protein NIES970_14910 [[Synechococcus] sp. NIES-970]